MSWLLLAKNLKENSPLPAKHLNRHAKLTHLGGL